MNDFFALAKAFVNRMLTFSRSAAFAGWLMGAWGALEAGNGFHWPPTKETKIMLLGLTIAAFGRSVLARAKAQPPEAES